MAQVFAVPSESIALRGGRSPSKALPGGCTLKRGSLIVKGGVEYRISSISKAGVVKLNYRSGGFAMFSHVSACKQLELSL